MKKVFVLMMLMSGLGFSQVNVILEKNKWSREKAETWYDGHKWITAADFVPSSAINQLEMWQEDTFDPKTIDRELGYAEGIGFNTMRVYLHSLAYKADPKGFKARVNQYLEISTKHGIQTMFVFFDDVWDAKPKIGKQSEPKPGTHNSGWVQDPGYPTSKDKSKFPELEVYVKDILKTFANDKRILLWDLYNEPGNNDKGNESMDLLKEVFTWGRHGRPMICTEYMARTNNSRFANTLPLLKKENIGAINWGLVKGKSNTIYAWNTPIISGEKPVEWFHDIFRENGTPYRQDEVELIKKLNSEVAKK